MREGGLALIVAGVVVIGGLVVHQTHVLEALEFKSVDARFAIRGADKPPKNVLIVGIDGQTFARLGLQWPFPRSIHAQLIRRLKQAGAKVIVYDVQFTEQTTPQGGGRGAERAAVEQDNTLIEAVHRAGNVVLATSEVGPHGGNSIFGGGGALARIGARAGAAVVPTDSDGVIRRMLFSVRGMRTLGVAAAEAAGFRPRRASMPGGSAWINFVGPAGTIPEKSFASVLRGEVPSSAFASKTVVVGATVSNLQDVHATPFNGAGLMSGAEVTANTIATVESGFALRSSAGYLAVLLIVCFGAAVSLAALRLSPAWTLAVALGVGAAYLAAAQLAFEAGSVLPICDPLAALCIGCVGAIAVDSLGERRRLRALERALGEVRGRGAQFFISYRKAQSQWVAYALHRELVDDFGRRSVFMDKTAIDAGAMYPRELEQASERCTVMLVLIGPEWANARTPDGMLRLEDPDDWVRREVTAGLRANCLTVPVLYDGACMPRASDLPDPLKPLAGRQAFELRGPDLDTEVRELATQIKRGELRSLVLSRDHSRASDAAQAREQTTENRAPIY